MNDITINNNLKALSGIYENMKPATRETYQTAIKQFFDYTNTGINKISELTPADIQDYINYLKTKKAYSNSTINIKISALKSLFNKASFLFNLSNPFEFLKKMNVKTIEKTNIVFNKEGALTTAEINKLLAHYQRRMTSDNIKTVYTAKRNYILINLLYYHGLRISEALNIKIDNITELNNLYAISIMGKGSKPRQIKISIDLYNNIIDLHKEGFLFRALSGKQLTRFAIFQDIKRLGKQLLNKNIHLHLFRHSFATNLIEKTKSINKVSKYLGHSSIDITCRIYDHNELSYNDLELLKN
jgi:site-specific recombinase XerD